MALVKVIPEPEDFRYIKQRVLISAASWSGSANASGYYTYSLSNLTPINTYNKVDYNLSPATPNTVATSAEQLAFSLIDYMYMADGYGVTSATLYAKTKPTTNFYLELCAGGEEAYPTGLEFVGFPEYGQVVETYTYGSVNPATMPCDGWLIGYIENTSIGRSAYVTVNGVYVATIPSTVSYKTYANIAVPVRAGDIVTVREDAGYVNNYELKLYAIGSGESGGGDGIVYQDYEWDNVPITTQYTSGGVYLVATASGYNVAKEGYTPISISLTNFQSAYKDVVMPTILPADNKVLFFSKTSQTLGKAYFRVVYKKLT